MTDIQRYEIEMDHEDGYDSYWTSVPCDSGEWVKWDDVQALLAERDALRAALGEIRHTGNNSDPAAIWMQKVAAHAMEPERWPHPGPTWYSPVEGTEHADR